MITATEIEVRFICSTCKVPVTCFCERHDCEHSHIFCPICEYIQGLKDRGVKPIYADPKDRGSYKWGE